jgi:hypothetical protein
MYCGNFVNSAILLMNIDPNLADLDNSNIRNTPFKFISKFTRLIYDDNGQSEQKLENFIEHKFKNKIIDEINIYVPKQNIDKDNFTFGNFNNFSEIFVKISGYFYMFYISST